MYAVGYLLIRPVPLVRKMFTIILVAVFLCTILVTLGYKKRPKNYPPGPMGLPFIGNITQIGLQGHTNSMKLSEKYGDILGLRIGSNWLIILNNAEDIRELFGRSEFSGRAGFNGFHDKTIEDANYGVIISTGKTWVEQRRFSLRTLRDFGFGKRSMESIIMEEVRELSAQLKELCGQPIKTPLLFNPAIFNVIWAIVAGQRYSYDDPKLSELQHLLQKFFKSANTGRQLLFTIFPELTKWKTRFPFLFPKNDGDRFREKVFDFFRTAIKDHAATISEGSPRDFIDTYLEEASNTNDPSSSFHQNPRDGDLPIISTLMDLFVAGSETTSSTLLWSFFLLGQHSMVQEKLAKEIRSLVGNREVLLAERPHLPYVDACILEIMRVSSLAPLGVPHAPVEDTMYKGFLFPKNSLVMGNLYAAHYNLATWGDPENFRPERFLDASEKTVIRNKAWMPFSTGKRQCMGESLARDELFLFLTNLVHNFEINMPEDEPKHSLVGVNEGVLAPEPHRILLRVRRNF